jgi:hypothetical protein
MLFTGFGRIATCVRREDCDPREVVVAYVAKSRFKRCSMPTPTMVFFRYMRLENP